MVSHHHKASATGRKVNLQEDLLPAGQLKRHSNEGVIAVFLLVNDIINADLGASSVIIANAE